MYTSELGFCYQAQQLIYYKGQSDVLKIISPPIFSWVPCIVIPLIKYQPWGLMHEGTY